MKQTISVVRKTRTMKRPLRPGCADPMSHFRSYEFFAMVRIRDGAGFAPNHWLFGSDN